MLKDLQVEIKSGFILLLVLTILTGFIYPLIITGMAQFFFPWTANGSIIYEGDKAIGSTLIGQSFTANRYFWGRPSMTTPTPYNGASSIGSSAGPSNPSYISEIEKRMSDLKQLDPNNNALIPSDIVTTSGSGLDPEISPLAAFYQATRIAQARSITVDKVKALIHAHIQERQFLLLGEPRVNVLELNIALDKQKW